MKLALLEDGVLDYGANRGAVKATPDGVPTASMGAGVKPAPKKFKTKSNFEDHIKDCPQCSKNNLCDTGKSLA